MSKKAEHYSIRRREHLENKQRNPRKSKPDEVRQKFVRRFAMAVTDAINVHYPADDTPVLAPVYAKLKQPWRALGVRLYCPDARTWYATTYDRAQHAQTNVTHRRPYAAAQAVYDIYNKPHRLSKHRPAKHVRIRIFRAVRDILGALVEMEDIRRKGLQREAQGRATHDPIYDQFSQYTVLRSHSPQGNP
jgi:hypothetical protein